MDAFRTWLDGFGLGRLQNVLSANSIDLDIVGDLVDSDLIDLGLTLGDRKRLLRAISTLRSDGSALRIGRLPQVPELAEDGEAHGQKTNATRRHLTLVFVDLVGSTQLSNELDSEAYAETLRRFRNYCIKVFTEHHGHVERIAGDGILVYFGFPFSEEDNAERAIIAALEIVHTVGALLNPSGRPLEVRIGIASGDVVIDNDHVGGVMALGNIPNLASRIQESIPPNTVAVSDETKLLLGDRIRCELLGEFALKGFSHPANIWAVRDLVHAELRFRARNHETILPMIGRSDEVTLLESRWRAACGGNGQVVLLSGEAGIGKSRIAEEFCERIGEDRHARVALQCLPNCSSSALSPVISMVCNLARVTATNSPDLKREKLRRYLATVLEDPDESFEILASLLALPQSTGTRPITTSPQQERHRILDVLARLFLVIAAKKPLIVLFEDLHWIDPSSEELIDLLVERTGAARILLLCTFRPEYRPRWSGLARVSSLTVSRLDQHDACEMVRSLLPAGITAPELQEQIAAKTDGVPLFVEEMTRIVLQRMALANGETDPPGLLALPSTLKDILQAKIDSLESARDLVPVCAAIGRSIIPDMVAIVGRCSVDTATKLLAKLAEEQILIPRGIGKDRSFNFRHALIQEAAYDLMLPSQARLLHRQIAKAMTEVFHYLAAENPDHLAHHFARAGMPAEARDAWCAAAAVATIRFGTSEAINHLGAALAENAKIADLEERTSREIEIRKSYNLALKTRYFRSREVLENMSRLHELLQRSQPDHADSFLSLHVEFGARLMIGHPKSADNLCPELHRIAQATSDSTFLALAAHDDGMAAFMLAEFDRAIACFDNAMGLRRCTSQENILGFHPADISVIDSTMRCWALALSSAEHETVRREMAAAEQSTISEPHEFSRCFGLSILAAAHQPLDDNMAIKRLAGAALAISNKRGFEYWTAWNHIILGWARAGSGEAAAGIAELQQGLSKYVATGSRQIELLAHTLLAHAYLLSGEVGLGLDEIDRVRKTELTNSVRYQKAFTDYVEMKLRRARAQPA